MGCGRIELQSGGVEPDEQQCHEQIGTLAELVQAWTGNHAQIYDIDQKGLLAHVNAGEQIVDE